MLIAHVIQDKGAVVHTIWADASLEEAAKALDARKIGALVVLDAQRGVIGVLSERDIVREVARRGAGSLQETVANAMSREVIVAMPTETVDEGLGRMTDRRIRHLPVLSGGELVGLISIGDLVKHRIAAVEAESAAMQAYIAAQ